MKTFFLILFFSKVILLSSESITIDSEWIEIRPEKKLSAITGGANLRLEIPPDDYRIQKIDKTGDIFKQLDTAFPQGEIEAILIGENNLSIRLNRRRFLISDFTFSKEDSVHLTLYPEHGMPTKIKFKMVKIRSNKKIENIKIYWKNYKI